jgi:methionyl-tRNA formyltransferase
LRLIFAGTPEFARVALAQLQAAGFEIALVLTQPDRPAGRGLKLQPSAVKQEALARGFALAQPRSLRLDGRYPEDAEAARRAIEAAQADAMVVAAYGLLLPQWVLDTMAAPSSAGRPRWGCLNIHASLLPRRRGAAPIHRALEAGDTQTGITIMQMDAGLDTGGILLAQALAIEPDDSTASLHDKLALLGGALIVQALQQLPAGSLKPVPQPVEGVTYAQKIDKQEAWIDWSLPALQIVRRILAFNPAPGASSSLQGEALKIWQAQVLPGVPPAGLSLGSILAASHAGIEVVAMNSIVNITQLQRPGGKRLAAAEFLRGFALAPGVAFAPGGAA